MASQFDQADFVDRDYQSSKASRTSGSTPAATVSSALNRPLTREELETKVSEAHQKLADLKRAQDELERERATLEEARRRRVELENGRGEMLQNLTRGIGLVEEAEFNARRDAEQMSKTLVEMREALTKVQAIREETWNPENWQTELTRALTAIENARMEWNRARLKWPLLNGADAAMVVSPKEKSPAESLAAGGFMRMCKIGLALTWPLVIVGVLGFGLLLLFLRR